MSSKPRFTSYLRYKKFSPKLIFLTEYFESNLKGSEVEIQSYEYFSKKNLYSTLRAKM